MEIVANAEQKPTTYQPTAVARQLLEVLLDPAHRFKNISEVCRLADISRDTYYRLFDTEEFVSHFKKESKKLVHQAQAKVINASIHGAVRGNAQHTKIILSMAGQYTEKTGLIINPDENGNPQSVRVMSDMDLAVRIARLLFKSPQVVEAVKTKLLERGLDVIEIPSSSAIVSDPGTSGPGVATEPEPEG